MSRALLQISSGGPPESRRPPELSLRPFEVLARTSLIFGTLGGFGLGLLLLLPVAFRLPVELPWLPLVQVHGQVQLLGFVVLFVFAVGTVLFPRFLSIPRWDTRRAELGGLLLAAGVLLRAVSQPLDPSPLRSLALLASAVLELAGPLMFATALHQGARQSVQPFGVWQLGLGIGFISLFGSLVLNLVAVLRLVVDQLSVVPVALSEAIVTLQVRGFVVGAILAVSLKVFPQFLILRTPRAGAFRLLLPAYGLGLLGTVLAWLLLDLQPEARPAIAVVRACGDLLMLAAVVGYVLALRLFEPPVRESGTPYVTNPTRIWFRLAYAWLLGANLLYAWFSLREALVGQPVGFTELSATRHALTMGFLMVLLFGMASRILPGYSAWAYKRPRFLWWTIGLLLGGASLRVGGELAGGYAAPFGQLTGLGGILGTAGFLVFAASLWPALGNLPGNERARR